MTSPSRLHELLDRAAVTFPDAPAVAYGDDVVTYRWLDSASRRVATWLSRNGVGRGDRVLSAIPTDVATPVLVYGCSRLGAVFIVIHEQTAAAGVAHILDDAQPTMIITDGVPGRELAAERGIVSASLAELRAAASEGDIEQPPSEPLSVDPVCLIYTSGSTGMPKAVVCTHAHVTFAATAIHSVLNYRSDDIVYCPLPLSFDYGLYQIFLCTQAGARLEFGVSVDAGMRLLAHLRETRATVLPAVPALATGLARMLSRPGTQPPEQLRLVTNTGAAMPQSVIADLRAALPNLHVQLMFGLTECKRATIMPVDEDLRRPGACGRALPGTEVFAVDEDGARLPAGDVGEIVVRGPNVMAGYWRHPELTAQRFRLVEGLFPQLHSGDYGWLDDDGYLYFTGRRDDLYKERGFRTSVTEVEAAAYRVAGVAAAAVLPPAAGRDGATLLAVTELTPQEVLRLMRNELEDFKVPKHCVVIPVLPLTGNGKVDRAALTRMITDGSYA